MCTKVHGRSCTSEAEKPRVSVRAEFLVNVFCHMPARADASKEAVWLARLAPEFARFGAQLPPVLRRIYTRFVEDELAAAKVVAELRREMAQALSRRSP